MAAASAATVGFPVATFLRLPKAMGGEEAMELAVSDLSDGAAVWGEHRGQQIVIVKTNGEVQAFNGACPHLGCIVQWEGTTRTFKCPCHGAVFNKRGDPIAGPVNTSLKRVKFEIKDGVLRIA